MLVDTHAHLADERLWDNRESLLQEAHARGVIAILSVGYDRSTSTRALELGKAVPGAGPTVGIHPNNLLNAASEDFEWVARSAAAPDVMAIGETGLDFHWNVAPEERQREAFRWHLELARKFALPLTLHSRDAESAVLDELQALPPPAAVLHCFGGNREVARRALDQGLYLGVAGPVTFPKSTDLRELVRWLPDERLLIETDAPYLSPHPYRGKTNTPARVRLVAETVAHVRGITFEDLAAMTTRNAFTLYPRLKVRAEAAASMGTQAEWIEGSGESRNPGGAR